MIPPIHSEIVSQSIELNDVVEGQELELQLGRHLLQRQVLRAGAEGKPRQRLRFRARPGKSVPDEGDRLRRDDPAKAGRDLEPQRQGCRFRELRPLLSGRLLAAAGGVMGAQYQQEHGSVLFDAEGNLIDVDRSIGAASGKWFQEGIFAALHRRVRWSATTNESRARGRAGSTPATARTKNFWEDTNNDARLLYDPPEGVPQ